MNGVPDPEAGEVEDAMASSQECLNGIKITDVCDVQCAGVTEDLRDVVAMTVCQIVHNADLRTSGEELTGKL
jgi:hypothetical protein